MILYFFLLALCRETLNCLSLSTLHHLALRRSKVPVHTAIGVQSRRECPLGIAALTSVFLLTLLTASCRVQHRFPARQGTKPRRDWLRDLYGARRLTIQSRGNPRVKQTLKFKWSRGKLGSHRAAHSLQLHTKNSLLARESMEESGCPNLCGSY